MDGLFLVKGFRWLRFRDVLKKDLGPYFKPARDFHHAGKLDVGLRALHAADEVPVDRWPALPNLSTGRAARAFASLEIKSGAFDKSEAAVIPQLTFTILNAKV